jgi:predicted enzyme related to lactoylglutathione lyase
MPGRPMDVRYVFAGLVVANRDSAADWYARLFDRPADMLPNESEAAWQLSDSASLYLLADPERAGRGVFTFMVDDLDAVLAGVAARGINPAPVAEMPGIGRKCVIIDPDGNAVSIAELV